MGRYKEPEYRPHPLLEELRPQLKRTARGKLKKSLVRVGQLYPVLVTMDNYILDGRARFELMQELKLKPQVRQLDFYSGVDATALPSTGFSLEDELQISREVIEETGRGKWLGARGEAAVGNDDIEPAKADHDIEPAKADHDIVNEKQANDIVMTLRPVSFAAVPCDGKPLYLQLPAKLREHLELMAIKTGATRKKGRNQMKVASVPEYIRKLCWADFIAHLPEYS